MHTVTRDKIQKKLHCNGGEGRVGHIIRKKNLMAILIDLYHSLVGMEGGFVKSF